MIIKKSFIYAQSLLCSLEQLFNLESSVDCFSMHSIFNNLSKILYSLVESIIIISTDQ